MLRTHAFHRLLPAAALVAAGFAGCSTSDSKPPAAQLATPVSPAAGSSVSLSTNRSSLRIPATATEEPQRAELTVQAFNMATWAPLPDQTKVLFTTTLGQFDSQSGPRSLELELFGGIAKVNLFPGTTAGTARVRAEVNGIAAVVQITIQEAGPAPTPAPTASTISLTATPSTTISEADAVDDGPSPTERG
jgi:hypothetical protein